MLRFFMSCQRSRAVKNLKKKSKILINICEEKNKRIEKISTWGQDGHLNMCESLKCFSRRLFCSNNVPHFWHLKVWASVVCVASASLVAKVILHFLHLKLCSALLCTSSDLALLHLKSQSLHLYTWDSMWRDISFLSVNLLGGTILASLFLSYSYTWGFFGDKLDICQSGLWQSSRPTGK